jgi:thiamine biosynthesis protein ThiS
MIITVNGEKKEVPEGLTIVGLLQFLKIQPERVAVELNLDIVKKDRYNTTPVKDGDSVEVVSFMAGGALSAKSNFKMKNKKLIRS